MKRTALFLTFCCLFSTPLLAQEKDSLTALFRTRYMHTYNHRGLANFEIMVSHGNVYYDRQLTGWLKAGVQANALLHYGIDNISTPDLVTGSGPIYEGNLWVRNHMDGRTEVALPQLYLQGTFGNSTLTIGRFLRNTPLINAEPWPFPNAMEGIWYENRGEGKWGFQLGAIWSLAPRQTGRFAEIGKTLGKAGQGRDIFGNPSLYKGNVSSGFIAMGNAVYKPNELWTVDAWNFFVENVFNLFVLEPQWHSAEDDWRVRFKLIYQRKVGEGGDENPQWTYMSEGRFANAYNYGLRLERALGGGWLQLNLNRIADKGRLLLPREWGLEPFYTFQRRTRVEGAADVSAFMLRYSKEWGGDRGKFRLFSSIGRTSMPDPVDAARNKFGVPSYSHFDLSPRYEFKKGLLNKVSIELYTAFRFLTGDISGNESFRINRADFFHVDAFITWRL